MARLGDLEAPEMTVVITDRAFVLAGLATLLVALGLASGMGWLAFGAMREASLTRETLEEARARAVNCESSLIRSDAKLEQMQDLIELAGGRKKPTAMGGGP